MTRERISRILELRKMLLSFKIGFNLVNAAVVCAILVSISGLEPSSDTSEPRYLKLVTVSSFCPFTLISLLVSALIYFFAADWAHSTKLLTNLVDAAVFVINLVFSALISMP